MRALCGLFAFIIEVIVFMKNIKQKHILMLLLIFMFF